MDAFGNFNAELCRKEEIVHDFDLIIAAADTRLIINLWFSTAFPGLATLHSISLIYKTAPLLILSIHHE